MEAVFSAVRRTSWLALVFVFVAGTAGHAWSADWYVAAGSSGDGSSASPFGRIQQGLESAQPGDTVWVGAGTYAESLRTVRSGASSARIVVRATVARSAKVTIPGTVLRVDHAYHTFHGLVLDGQYGLDDLVDVNSGASGLILRSVEILRTSRDCVDMSAPKNVLIDTSLIHHCLNATNGRSDAHGVVAGAVRGLTIRKTEIHTFSGDGVQVDPDRSAPGWDNVVIERSTIWLAPLTTATNGFAAGTVTGENAIDTKSSTSYVRARLYVRDSVFRGFRGGLIANMAALNIKENVDAKVDRVTVSGSEIAFRLRFPALVRLSNALVYDSSYGVRYEDGIQGLKVWNTTMGLGVKVPFVSASSSGSVLDVRNFLLLGALLPAQARNSASNTTVGDAAFVNAAAGNYRLVNGAPAVDRGETLPDVKLDRAGVTRPQGAAYDIGAYELVPR